MKCLKLEFVWANLKYLHRLFYFLFGSILWRALKISKLISQSKKHEKNLALHVHSVVKIESVLNCFIPFEQSQIMWPTVIHVSEFKWQRKGNVCVKEHELIPSLSSLPLWLMSGSRQRDKASSWYPGGKGRGLGQKTVVGQPSQGDRQTAWREGSQGRK